MFCPKCGQEILDNSKFCTFCGNIIHPAAITQTVHANITKNQEEEIQRKDTIAILEQLLSYASVKAAEFQHYDDLDEEYQRRCKPQSKAALIWGIIVTVAGLMVGSLLTEDNFNLLTYFFCTLPGVSLIGLHIFLRIRGKYKRERVLEEKNGLYNELTAYMLAYPDLPIGCEYTNPAILTKIIDRVRQGRAISPREAINVLLTDFHHTVLEAQAALVAQGIKDSGKGSFGGALVGGFLGAAFFS